MQFGLTVSVTHSGGSAGTGCEVRLSALCVLVHGIGVVSYDSLVCRVEFRSWEWTVRSRRDGGDRLASGVGDP